MEKKDVCEICRQEIAKYTCRMCGARVCENCYDKASGLCLKCKQGRTMELR